MSLFTLLLEVGRLHPKGSYQWLSINPGGYTECSALLEVLGPGSILLNNCIDGLDEGIKTMLIKFAASTKLGGIVIALQDRNKIRNGLDLLRKWPYKIGINFNGDKCKAAWVHHSPRTVPWAYLVLSKYLQYLPCRVVVRIKVW